MDSGICRLRDTEHCQCRAHGLRGDSRTFADDARNPGGASERLSAPATNFDDMTAAPVLSAVLSARAERGICGVSGRKSSSSIYSKRRSTSRQSIVKKLREAFTIGIYFLSILRLPVCSAVPLGRSAPLVTMAEDRFSTKPKWINACGANVDGTDGRQMLDGRHSPILDPEGEVSHLSDKELISTILIVAKRAQMNAERWRREYVNQTFNLDFHEHHEAWKKHSYKWLPTSEEIPKELYEHIPKEHLEGLTLVDALKNIYTSMQKYACGLEQVTWDLEDLHSPFSKNFTDAELELRDIICEIEVALIEKGEKTPTDIQRNIMPDEFRTVDHQTHRNLRDWLILRDYMNGVEYVIQVLEYLKNKIEEETA